MCATSDPVGADEAPIPLATILEVCGLEDALWCLRTCDGGLAVAAEIAAWCATRAARHAAIHAAYAARASDAAAADAAAARAFDAATRAANAAERALQAEHLRSLIA